MDVELVLQQHDDIGAVFSKALAEKTSSQLDTLAQVWQESKQRSDETKQAEQERGDVASVAAAKEAKVASLAAEAELVRMLLEAKELGLDVEPLLQQHEGVRAVFEKASAEAETKKQLQALTQVWVESKQRSDETKQAEQERGDAASVAAAAEAKVVAAAAEAELVRVML